MVKHHMVKPAMARFRTERRGGKHVVLDPDGAVVAADTGSLEAATRLCARLQADADGKAKRGPRRCMCCQATFHSEGIHNRLCKGCSAQSSERAYNFAPPRRRVG